MTWRMLLAGTNRCCACAVFLVGVFSLSADEPSRTWTDSTGKFKIEARFVSETSGKVTLAKADGSQLEIDLNKLSTDDQRHVADLKKAADNPFKPKEVNPFIPVAPTPAVPATTAAPDTIPAAAGAAPRHVKVDWSRAQIVALTSDAADWKVAPPAPAAPLFAAQPKAVALPPKTNFFEGLHGLAVNPVAQKAIVGYTLGEPKPEGKTRIVICDLATGKAEQPGTVPGLFVPIAVHDNGRYIVMRSNNFGFGKHDRLEIWSASGSTLTKVLECVPFDEFQGGSRDVLWAEFVDAGTLALSSRGGKVALCNVADMQPTCTFELADGCMPALSPDRKMIAWCDGKQLGLFDLGSRQVIAQVATPRQLQWPHLAFSPTGKQLGCVAFDHVLSWDVATGKLARDIPAAGLNINAAIEFPADDYVLGGEGGNVYLFDLPDQLKFWHYTGQERARACGGYTFFAVAEGNKPGALLPVQLPQAAATDLLHKALQQSDLFVFRRGTTVRLDVSKISDAAQHKTVHDTLTSKLIPMDCKVGDNGTIDLVASVEGPTQREVSYMHSGTYQVQSYTTRLKMVYQGKTAWETSGTNVPGMIMLKRGENVAGYLRDHEKPDYKFFERVELPKFVQKPSDATGPPGSGVTLGSSRVTTGGIR